MRRVKTECVASFGLEGLEGRSLMAADLVPGGVTVISPPYPTITPTRSFTFAVANVGTTGVGAGTVVGFYLSRDTVLDASDRFVRRSVVPDAIRPGTSVAYTKVMRIPADLDGDFRLLAKIDPDDTIAESNESNNTLPSAAFNVFNPPRAESVTLNKLYVRPGSQATITAHNVTNVDPVGGVVRFYRRPGTVGEINPGNDPRQVLLGTGTRQGSDYTFTLVADNAWLEQTNTFFVTIASGGHSWYGGVQVEGRRLQPPTIQSFAFSPLVRGQTATFTATGVSTEATGISISFDSNFNGRFDQYPTTRSSHDEDQWMLDVSSGGWTRQFQVPDWFPSSPALVFVAVSRAYGQIQRVYPTYLSAT